MHVASIAQNVKIRVKENMRFVLKIVVMQNLVEVVMNEVFLFNSLTATRERPLTFTINCSELFATQSQTLQLISDLHRLTLSLLDRPRPSEFILIREVKSEVCLMSVRLISINATPIDRPRSVTLVSIIIGVNPGELGGRDPPYFGQGSWA